MRDFRINELQLMATENSEKAIDVGKLREIDITEIFYKELDIIAKRNELLNMNLNGPPNSGKSTVAMSLAKTHLGYKRKWKHTREEFGIHNINRDQGEFSKEMRNPELKDTIRVIDEWNELETTVS